jgi:hypothetical protein
MSKSGPVFIRGYSRSGGTLMVTILDAHPQIAMSYELYPHLLSSSSGAHINIDSLIKTLNTAKNIKSAGKKIDDRNLRTFILRAARGNLNNRDLARLLKIHVDDGMDFSDTRGRLKFVERCCTEKMKKEGKIRWGLKCSNKYEDYLSMWPDAYFINIIRDGRDVLASQLNTGSFNKTPADVAKGWVNTHSLFRKLTEKPDVHAYEIYYENLVQHPEEEIRKLCDFLKIPFDKALLLFYQKDLTIYAEKTGHLSAKRISKPIDASKVGRWKKDVMESQLKEFYSVAGEAMRLFGYPES